VIAPDGAVRHRTAEFTREVTVSAVPLLSDRTLADRVGAWPEVVLTALAIGAALAATPRRRPVTVPPTTVVDTTAADMTAADMTAEDTVRRRPSGDGDGT
jgi:apolipoprotein N-acyltransferase